MQKNVILSERLAKVASFLPSGAFFADIGSDHAYLPCHVCQNDPTAKAIAGEINDGPFASAKAAVAKYGFSDRVEVRKGNGLEVLHPDDGVKQLVIAGMGGSLIRSILEEGKSKLGGVKRIVAQPNIDARAVRKWLYNHEFFLTQEAILEENGHIYEILVADRTAGLKDIYHADDIGRQMLFGPYNLLDRNDTFIKKWKSEAVKLEKVIGQMKAAKEPDQAKISQFEQELIWMQEV